MCEEPRVPPVSPSTFRASSVASQDSGGQEANAWPIRVTSSHCCQSENQVATPPPGSVVPQGSQAWGGQEGVRALQKTSHSF